MKLVDAVRAANAPSVGGHEPFRLLLCCAFTPLHLETFVVAHVRNALGGRAVAIDTTLYGTGVAALTSTDLSRYHVVCGVVEWADLDPRLGFRQLGGWRPSVHADIVFAANERLQRIEDALGAAALQRPVVACLPTLPLPPLSFTAPAQASRIELQLRAAVARCEERLAAVPNVSIVNRAFLDERSPAAARFDLKSELVAGFPYAVAHAAAVGEALTALAVPRMPKKALISDLDDTLWGGLVGEVGPDGVTFDLDAGTQIHAVYQQFLASLAEAGVLIGVATRNDAEVVTRALGRSDLLISRERLFPIEAHWGAKSESVARILAAWNLSADAVVVVDDSERELDEIRRAFPHIECRRFAGPSEPGKVLDLLAELKDLFGRAQITEEDAIRTASMRARSSTAKASPRASDEVIAEAGAELTVDLSRARGDGRAFELVNKTNQFNLNGRRYTVAEWDDAISAEGAFVLTVAYTDRYGPLGRIAVIAGRWADKVPTVSTWVMSCRAFARHIEHRCLVLLFETLNAASIRFEFGVTSRNAPARRFFAEMLGYEPDGPFVLRRTDVEARCPDLHQKVHVNA